MNNLVVLCAVTPSDLRLDTGRSEYTPRVTAKLCLRLLRALALGVDFITDEINSDFICMLFRRKDCRLPVFLSVVVVFWLRVRNATADILWRRLTRRSGVRFTSDGYIHTCRY